MTIRCNVKGGLMGCVMPFIKTKVSSEITEEQERLLKSRFGKAIELVPGKSEEYLLLEFEGQAHLWLRGEQDFPIVYIEAAIFGNEGHYGYQRDLEYDCGINLRGSRNAAGTSPSVVIVLIIKK